MVLRREYHVLRTSRSKQISPLVGVKIFCYLGLLGPLVCLSVFGGCLAIQWACILQDNWVVAIAIAKLWLVRGL